MYTLYSDNSPSGGIKRPRFSSQPLTEKKLILVLQDSFFFWIMRSLREIKRTAKDHGHPYKINGKEMFIHNGKGKEYSWNRLNSSKKATFDRSNQSCPFQKRPYRQKWSQSPLSQLSPLDYPCYIGHEKSSSCERNHHKSWNEHTDTNHQHTSHFLN